MENTNICLTYKCDKTAYSRGLCQPHYRRELKNGAPKRKRACKMPEEKLSEKSKPLYNGCILWQGTLNGSGYGLVWHNNRAMVAHRLAYELTNGAIPDGHFVDHVCFNHACINPEHLRLATPKQNAENLKGARSDSATGVRGVSRTWDGSKFKVRVFSEGKCYRRGPFSNIEDAEMAAKELRAHLFTHSQD